jgi:hypothetical protein
MLHKQLIEQLPEHWKQMLLCGVTFTLMHDRIRMNFPRDIIRVSGPCVESDLVHLPDSDAGDRDRRSSQSSPAAIQKDPRHLRGQA